MILKSIVHMGPCSVITILPSYEKPILQYIKISFLRGYQNIKISLFYFKILKSTLITASRLQQFLILSVQFQILHFVYSFVL